MAPDFDTRMRSSLCTEGGEAVGLPFDRFRRRLLMRIRISSTTRGARMDVNTAPHIDGSTYQAFLGREPAPEACAERAKGFILASSGVAAIAWLFFSSPIKGERESFRGPEGVGAGGRPSNSAKPMVGPRRAVVEAGGLGALPA